LDIHREQIKGYKIYDLERKRFMINRDVTFFEKKFHYIDESKLDRIVLSENLIIPEDNEEIETQLSLRTMWMIMKLIMTYILIHVFMSQ
jgi:hypothetical protein